MAKLTTLIVPAALAALAAAATPAMASSAIHRPVNHHANYAPAQYVGHGQAIKLQRDITRLDARIDKALANRKISRREATSLQRDANNLQRLFARSQRGGLTRFEARTLESRLALVNRALRAERRDGNWRRS